jgi:hypothetical protein
VLAATLAAGGDGPRLARRLEGLCLALAPEEGGLLKPVGREAAEADAVGAEVLALLAGVADVRAAAGAAGITGDIFPFPERGARRRW